ncbi:MAG: Hsp20 family protein, partial [Spiroplasma ixodetis]|nr:Hsp20 family protein [Spiroplasma ixodetis]
LPSNISEESIDANFKNGILIVKIPKKEQTKTKKLQLNNSKKLVNWLVL